MTRPRKLLKQFWTDHGGKKWRVPNIKDRLRTHQIAGHAALKAFVICRAGGKCAMCGATEQLLADHIISRRNGGTHHPDNLQCLCKPCNDRKSNYEDRGREPPVKKNFPPEIRAIIAQIDCPDIFCFADFPHIQGPGCAT